VFESDFLTNPPETYRRLMAQTTEILAASLPTQPYSGHTPAQLQTLLSSGLIPPTGVSSDEISSLLSTVIRNSINVAHPHTIAHLHCPPLLAALAAEVAITALNQSMDSFDQAPIATILEQHVIRWLCSEAGLPASSDGTFTTGGSLSNYQGLLLARDAYLQRQWNWSAQKRGLPPEASRLRILCSEVAHFTVEKSAAQLGLGTNAVVRVAVDDHFRMSPSALRDALQKLNADGLVPMAIVATAGTTDFGSIDPLPAIASLAQQASAWLHVDAAYGGALLFSSHREELAGIELTDSLSIDFHKLLWQPIPCSVFLLRDRRHFDFIRMNADYLNPESFEAEGVPNLVTTSLLTSRRFDALKLWISFQILGRTRLAAMIDHTIALASDAAEMIRRTPQLQLTCDAQLSTVVFRYMPERETSDPDAINSAIRQRLLDRGLAVIGHTRVRGKQCLKFTCMNPTATQDDLQTLIESIVREGKEMEDRLVTSAQKPS
jgi:L-2,4-diaminobutyrate decarboxylase